MAEPETYWERLKAGICPSCGEKGPHFVPPGFGSQGFFFCTERLLDGERVSKDSPEWLAAGGDEGQLAAPEASDG